MPIYIAVSHLLKYFCLLFKKLKEELWPVLTKERQALFVPGLIHMIRKLRYIFTLNIFSIIVPTKTTRHLRYDDLM